MGSPHIRFPYFLQEASQAKRQTEEEEKEPLLRSANLKREISKGGGYALIALPRMPKMEYKLRTLLDFRNKMWPTFHAFLKFIFFLVGLSTSGATKKEGRKRRLSRTLKAPNPTVSHTLILSAGNFHPFF